MKRLLTSSLFLILLFACRSIKSTPSRETKIIDNGFSYINILQDTTTYICDSIFNRVLISHLDTIKNIQDTSYAVGQFGKCNPDDKVGFRIGKWTQYYLSGNIKSQGNYGLGFLRNCGPMGYGYDQYSYKLGRWIYYYENRSIKADILFEITKSPIISRGCGDTVYYKKNLINPSSKFFDLNQKEIIADSLLFDTYLRENQGVVDK